MSAKFLLGRTVITSNAGNQLKRHEVLTALGRHVSGDWGNVSKDDHARNEQALKEGERLLSVYRTEAGLEFWIITEEDHSVTTVLLPEDY